jgi:HPt (histidine-containing phosphotransfer) domain-containing protein
MLDRYLATIAPASVIVPELDPPGQTKPVHIQRIQAISDGDFVFERELIESFLSNTEEHLRSLEAALHEGNGEEVERQAHTIKGSSANAGARGMQEIADRIEQIGSSDSSVPGLELLPEITSEFERVRAFFRAYLESRRFPRQGQSHP